jgi:hypothetical protein
VGGDEQAQSAVAFVGEDDGRLAARMVSLIDTFACTLAAELQEDAARLESSAVTEFLDPIILLSPDDFQREPHQAETDEPTRRCEICAWLN